MSKSSKLIFVFLFCLCNIDIVFANTNLTIMPIDTSDWGDATLLESSGKYLLMDVSRANSTDVMDTLIDKNVQKFDVYLSHYHDDHYGGYNKLTTEEGISMDLIEYIVRNKGKGGYREYIYDIGTLYLPDASKCEVHDQKTCLNVYKKLSEAAKEMNVNVVNLSKGSKFSLGTTTAEVLYLNQDALDNENNNSAFPNNSSLVTMFTNGNTKFLTAGDIQHNLENKILEKGINVSADIFKLNHHGIQDINEISNTQEFVNAVKPKYAYFQFNIENDWKYDYDDIAKSIENLSPFSNLYTPAINGSIKFVIENDTITPIAEKNVHKITINYKDKDNNQTLDTKVYKFSYNFYDNDIKYHLYDYEKQFNNYNFIGDLKNIKTTGILKEDITYDLYYKKNQEEPEIKEDLDDKDDEIDKNENLKPDDNPQTGDISIVLVCVLGLLSIGYAVYYFKPFKKTIRK